MSFKVVSYLKLYSSIIEGELDEVFQSLIVGLGGHTRLKRRRICSSRSDFNLSGHLSDAEGQAINASRAMTFRIYDEAEGGVAIWESSYADVAIVDGIFSVVLGAQRAFSDTMVQADNLYLGVTVGQDQEMRPRMRIGGALKSQWAAVAAHARDVRGEDIHPSSVSINDGWWSMPMANGSVGPGPRGPQGIPGERGPQGDPGERGLRRPAHEVMLDLPASGVPEVQLAPRRHR